MMARRILFWSLIFAASGANATPVISTISWTGSLGVGTTITLTTTGAGTKPRANPIIYDNFDQGTIQPDAVYSASTSWTSVTKMVVTSSNCYSGAGCAGEVSTWTAASPFGLALEIQHETLGPGTSYYWNWVWKGNEVSYSTDNWKTWRWWAGNIQLPDMYCATQTNDDFGCFDEPDVTSITGLDRFYWSPFTAGNTPAKLLPKSTQYDGVEILVKVSSGIGATDGTIDVRHNGQSVGSLNTWRSNQASALQKGDFFFQQEWTQGGGPLIPPPTGSYGRYDNVYMDSSWCRVFVTTSSTGVGIHDPAPPTAWADTSIQAIMPSAPYSNGQTLYVWVADANNNISASAPIVFNSTSSGGGGGGSSTGLVCPCTFHN